MSVWACCSDAGCEAAGEEGSGESRCGESALARLSSDERNDGLRWDAINQCPTQRARQQPEFEAGHCAPNRWPVAK